MTTSDDNKSIFFERLAASLRESSGCKATLSKPRGELRWKRVTVSPFIDSRGDRAIALTYDDGRQVERKNHSPEEAYDEIARLLTNDFFAAHLRVSDEELQFERSERDTYRLKQRRSRAPLPTVEAHNRAKHYLVDPHAPFLAKLGIANSAGSIRREMYDKFRQINKFIEIISHLIPDTELSGPNGVSAIDFGSGKHYLTFALYDFLRSRSANSSVRGIEQRSELVSVGEQIATSLDLRGLCFETGSIAHYSIESVDLVVALHACDTATDDAIAKAIQARAKHICVAPCCHKYVRARFTSSADLHSMLRHGILEERFAEGLTDSLRVLTLEAMGYSAKLFEFISLEHTAKNVMITATRTGKPNTQSLAALRELCRKFSLPDFYLDRALGAGLDNAQ